MKNKSKKILLGGGSVLVASSLAGSSMSVNVSAGDEGFLVWIATNFWACIMSYLSLSNGDVKKNNKNNKNDVGTQKTSPKEGRQDQLKVSEEESKKQELLKKERKERLDRIGNLANKLKERLGDKIQLILDEKNGCYSGKIKFNNSVELNTGIEVKRQDSGKFSVIVGGCALRLCCVQKKCTEEEKVDNVVNCVADWYSGVEARLKKLDELAQTGQFSVVKDSDTRYVKLYPKENLKLKIKDEGSSAKDVGTVTYNVVTDKLNFYSEVKLRDMDAYSAYPGLFELRFRSDGSDVVNENAVSNHLSIFDRFVNQIKSNASSNDVTFKVSGEDASVEDNQENLDAAVLCFLSS